MAEISVQQELHQRVHEIEIICRTYQCRLEVKEQEESDLLDEKTSLQSEVRALHLELNNLRAEEMHPTQRKL